MANLPFNHPIRAELEERATIVGGRDAAIRIDGMSVDDAIAELRKDKRYAGTFEAPAKEIDHNDMRELTKNFTAIAEGKITVK